MSDGIPEHIWVEVCRRVDELKRAREGLGWSQSGLALRAGVSQATVSAIERHCADPKLVTYLLLADATMVLRGDNLAHLPRPQRALVRTRRRMGALCLARDRRNLTQVEVAEALGTKQSCVSEWETGEVVARLSSYLRLAEVVGVDV